MARKSDKKTVIVLLVVLGVVLIGSATWLFNILKPVAAPPMELQADLQLQKVYRIKEMAIENMSDFLKLSFAPESIWDNLYNSEQFKELNDLEIDINTEDDVGNPQPFIPVIEEEPVK